MPELPAAPQIEYRDRKTGLVVFGVFMVLAGGFMALCVPLMILGQVAAAKTTQFQANWQAMTASAVFCLLGASIFIWLGIGSILARRWARALILVLSWTWLAVGVVSMIYLVFLLPQIMQSIDAAVPPGQKEIPRELKTTILIVEAVFFFFFYVVLPGIWVLFYRSESVRATCEVRDPVPRWTDRCPLPVLALSLWAGVGAIMMLLVAFLYRGIMPFFGTFLSGIWGMVGWILIAIFWGYSARALYRLERSGWWILLVGMCLVSISAFVTYSRHDIGELYRLMGYPEEQIALIQRVSPLKSGTMAWASLLFTVPFVGYLFYVRRFFTRPAA